MPLPKEEEKKEEKVWLSQAEAQVLRSASERRSDSGVRER